MIKALVIDVKKVGAKVKVVLSRSRPLFVQRLLEQEIPEISENVIEIVNVSREAGRRTKVAVVSNDPHIDLVGACVGVRGSRSRAITDELGGERIDVVPWTADTAEYIRNALKPAIVYEVMLCTMLGRAIVLVQREQRSIAIGRGGQNVRLASRLCKWDVDVMNRDELDQIIEKAMSDFMSIDGVDEELADALVGQGFLSFDDLSIIEPSDLMSLGNLTEDQVESITSAAEELAQEQEAEKEREKQLNDEERSEEDSSAPQL